MLPNLIGTVSDVAPKVKIGGTFKDLLYVTNIEAVDDKEFVNSAGIEGEGWFATIDVSPVEDGPQLFSN